MPLPYSLAFVLCLVAFPAATHEYWIEASKPRFEAGEALTAELKIGENFKGNTQIYSEASFDRFVVYQDETLQDIEGTLGDTPALNLPDAAEGLAIAGYISSLLTISYTEFGKFEDFARAHGELEAIELHAQRGLPKENFREAYRRYAKSLLPVGDGQGQDVSFGLAFELTALQSPYSGAPKIAYRLTRDDLSAVDHQVDVFFLAPGAEDAEKLSLITDANGVVMVPVRQGKTLVNAVALEPAPELMLEKLDVVWYSLWASSTFWLE